MDLENGTHISVISPKKWCWIHAITGMTGATLTVSVNPLYVDFAFPNSLSNHRLVKKHVVEADVLQHLSPWADSILPQRQTEFPPISCCTSVSLNLLGVTSGWPAFWYRMCAFIRVTSSMWKNTLLYYIWPFITLEQVAILWSPKSTPPIGVRCSFCSILVAESYFFPASFGLDFSFHLTNA